MRVSKKEYYLNIAKEVSKRSTCLKRQYGAVIVNNDEIVSTGYNGSPRGEANCCDLGVCHRLNEPNNTGNYDNCCSVHAEQNAIISASRKEMLGGVLYLYGFDASSKLVIGDREVGNSTIGNPTPCPICMRMLKNAGIVKVITLTEEIDIVPKKLPRTFHYD